MIINKYPRFDQIFINLGIEGMDPRIFDLLAFKQSEIFKGYNLLLNLSFKKEMKNV